MTTDGGRLGEAIELMRATDFSKPMFNVAVYPTGDNERITMSSEQLPPANAGENKCSCVLCSHCKGRGRVFFSIGDIYHSHPQEYRCDDLDDVEPCEHCNNGVIEICDFCRDQEVFDDNE